MTLDACAFSRRAVLTLVAAAVTAGATAASAKTPGKTYCYNNLCHRVKTPTEMDKLVGFEETVTASFYEDCKVDKHNPCSLLSSGEEMRADLADNAASPVYPNGTLLLVSNPRTNATLLLRVNNSGPYVKGRLLDVSRAAAEQLGFIKNGVAKLNITVLSGPLRGAHAMHVP